MDKFRSCPKIRMVRLEVSTNIFAKNFNRFEFGKYDIELYLFHPYVVFVKDKQNPVLVPVSQARDIHLQCPLEDLVNYMSK